MEKEVIALRAGESQNKYENGHHSIIAVLFCFILLAGMVLLWKPLFPLQNGILFLITGTIVSALIIIVQLNKVLEIVLPFLCLFTAFSLLFFHMETVIQGMLGIANILLENYNKKFDAYIPLYQLPESEQKDFLWTILVLGILFGLFIGYAIWRRWFGALTVVIFLMITAGCLLQKQASFPSIILLLAVWFGCWSGNKRSMDYGWRTGFCLLIITLLIGGILSFCFSRYEPNVLVTNIRKQIETAVHHWRFGEDSLPKGDLRRAGSIFKKEQGQTDEEEVLLELSFTEAEEMYLKGFVGTEYDGQSWKQLSNDAYTGKREGMLDWMNANRYCPIFPYASQQEAAAENCLSQTVTVKNRGADRYYVYVPETVGSVNAEYALHQDWQLCSSAFFGVHSYQFENLRLSSQELWEVPAWLEQGETKEEEKYIQAEEVYRSFVYDYYLDVEENVKEKIETLFFSGDKWRNNTEEQKKNLYNATTRIRVMLGSLAKYAAQTEEVPAGEDFVTWFLEDNKEGNAVHFATTAVLAYRTLGIPARYVEGYYLNKDLADRLSEEKADSCNLTQENEHAWVEIYMDGVGWNPVEVTPGFYREAYNPDYLVNIQEEEIEAMDKGSQIEVDEVIPGIQEKKKSSELSDFPWNYLGIFILVILIFLSTGLLLEIQRGIRIGLQERRRKNNPDARAVLSYRKMCQMLKSTGIKDNFAFPYELADQICEQFDSIKKEEYVRFIQIIQKDIFGHKILFPNEYRIIEVFIQKLRTEIYGHASILKKLLYRYVYCH